LALNLPLVGVFVSVLRTPTRILMPIVAILCLTGVYAVNSSSIDIWVLVISGIGGYLLRSRGYDLAPLVLAVVLGPKVELYFRQSLFMSAGDLSIFVNRPISLAIILIPVSILAAKLIFYWGGKRKTRRP